MSIRSIALAATFTLAMASSGVISAQAQQPSPIRADDAVHLFDSLREKPASLSTRPELAQPQSAQQTVSELRLARGQYQAQQRLARLERNAWNRYQPLRPTWNSTPMTSSSFSARRTIYVPVYIRTR